MKTFRLSEFGKYADESDRLQAKRLISGLETAGPVYQGYNRIGTWVINPAAETVSVLIPKGGFSKGSDGQRAGAFVATQTEAPELYDECLRQIIGSMTTILENK